MAPQIALTGEDLAADRAWVVVAAGGLVMCQSLWCRIAVEAVRTLVGPVVRLG